MVRFSFYQTIFLDMVSFEWSGCAGVHLWAVPPLAVHVYSCPMLCAGVHLWAVPPLAVHVYSVLCCVQVFICGPYPHWLFMSARGAMRCHPMGIDGWVSSFAPFNNVNCPKGFLYFNKQVTHHSLAHSSLGQVAGKEKKGGLP